MFIGKRVKEARLKKGMSQQELGDLLDVSKVSVCGYETGNRTPTIETFDTLIDVLDIDANYVLGKDVLVVGDTTKEYKTKMSKEDLEIISEIKKHRELYHKLCENPKRTVEILNMKLNK